MTLLESLILAKNGLKAYKLRAFFTVLGIVVGIASVIIVMSLGQGGVSLVGKEFEKLGTNIFSVYIDWGNDKPRKADDLVLMDIDVIKKLLPEVTKIAPVSFFGGNIKGDKDQRYARLIGTTDDYGELYNINLLKGRFLSSEDIRGQRRVAVLEDKLVEEIVGIENIVGQNVHLSGVPVLVIGIIKTEEETLLTGSGLKTRNVYIPFDFLRSVTGVRLIHSIQGKTFKSEQVDNAIEKTLKILERRHNKKTGFYKGVSLEKEMNSAKRTIETITLIIGIIAGISLLVGGIGVMNIMLVSVTERTREIGIRKALGADHKDILLQFIFEAVLICLTGGIIGIVVGIFCSYIIAEFSQIPFIISWFSIFYAFIFSIVVGLFFGIYPANKAAKLEPIGALRYE